MFAQHLNQLYFLTLKWHSNLRLGTNVKVMLISSRMFVGRRDIYVHSKALSTNKSFTTIQYKLRKQCFFSVGHIIFDEVVRSDYYLRKMMFLRNGTDFFL